MRLVARSSALTLAVCCLAPGFFSNPNRVANLTLASGARWETSDVGAVWSDDFDRATLGTNWVIVSDANASIVGNELRFAETNADLRRQVYYDRWLTSSDHWTLRWTQRFGATNAASYGLGVGILNFQAAGGNDRGYNALLNGAGANYGQMEIERWDGTWQNDVTYGSAMALAPGDLVDCWLTRSGWTLSATASNRANGQVSTTSLLFSDFVTPRLEAPTISRMCFYPLQGTVFVDNLSFTINRRKPARFVVIGDSISEGYDASDYPKAYISVIQSNFTQAVCNESSSYNTTDNSLNILPEVMALRPETVILMIGGNDLYFGYPTAQWQDNYSNLVAQLQANGVKVKHCWPTPRTPVDLRPLKTWISANYPAQDVIDTWTPLVTKNYELKPVYDNYDNDGVHPNDAGHLLIGQIIRTNLP